jgi:hypothetical protein
MTSFLFDDSILVLFGSTMATSCLLRQASLLISDAPHRTPSPPFEKKMIGFEHSRPPFRVSFRDLPSVFTIGQGQIESANSAIVVVLAKDG